VTSQRFIVGAGVVGLAVLTLLLFTASLAGLSTARLDSFQRSADTRKIIVNITIGVGDEVVERSASEDAQSVRVTVRVRQAPGPKVSLGVPVPLVIALKEPLGSRAVLDDQGHPVRDLGTYVAPGTPAP
jgi:hypothetical protein